MAELDASGNIQAVNTFGAQGLVSRRTVATGASVFYTFDERGNVAQRLDSTSSALSADLYDAFGARTGTATASDPWRFGAQWGYQSDAETGLVLCTNRYYDPQQGRFLTRDPLGYEGGVNLYSYTQNNPVNWLDPSGLATVYLHIKPVNGIGKQHTYLVVTDTDPAHSKTGIRGGGEGNPFNTNIYVWIAPYYDQSFPDHQGTAEGGKPILLVNDNKPASYYLNKFRAEADLINKQHIPYSWDTNSNTVTSDMLNVVGISCPNPPARAQGFGNPMGIDDDPPDDIQRNSDYSGWGYGMKQGR